jgi:hypothetical protein
MNLFPSLARGAVLTGSVLLAGTAALAQGLDAAPLPQATPPPPLVGNANIDLPVAEAEATGRVMTFEPQRRLLTLDNGETFLLAATVPGTETLTPGQLVAVTYKREGENKVAQMVKSVTAVPEADAPGLKPPVN